MGQGTGTSAGGAGGGGMGLGILSSLFGGAGGGSIAPQGQTSSTGDISYASANFPMQQGFMEKLGALLKDPQVIQALGQTAQSIGRTIAAADKIPGPAAEMLQQAIQSGGVGAGAGSPQVGGTYVGDIGSYIPPEFAATLLNRMGIPAGFSPMIRERQ